MSNVVRLRVPAPAERGFYLGPAEVISTAPHEIAVRLPRGGAVPARLALAFPYQAQPGDQVLVIGTEEGHYVIGVLQGNGQSTLSFPADVELRAGGTLTLAADRGVVVDAPAVSVAARKIEMIAAEVTNTFRSLRQRVSELWSVHAGQAHTVVEGSSHTQAKSATIQTEGKVAINGKEIHLG